MKLIPSWTYSQFLISTVSYYKIDLHDSVETVSYYKIGLASTVHK